MAFAFKINLLWRLRRPLLWALLLLPVLAGIYVVAFWIRFEGVPGPGERASLTATIGAVVTIKLLAFAWFRILQGWNRFVTFHDFVALAQASTAGSVLLALADYLFVPWATVPRSVFLMDWLATIVVISVLRSLRRFLSEHGLPWMETGRLERAFIVGVNGSGEALLRVIRGSRKLRYRVVGFIDDRLTPREVCIAGVPILGSTDNLFEQADRHAVSTLLITADGLPGRAVRAIINRAGQRGIEVKMLPSFQQLLSGDVAIRPRDVSIEDLLRRPPAELSLPELRQWIEGRVVLITGSSGSIGSEICRQLLPFRPRRLVLVDRAETGQFFLERDLRELGTDVALELLLADVCDAPRLSRIFAQFRPDIVFHAAAYKHVPLVEDNPGEGVKNTVAATKLLADLSEQSGVASFVMISTDKAVNPTSVMGCCKRVAELYVQSLAADSRTSFVTVRFGNVLDSAGSVVPIFRQQIAGGGPVTITHPGMTRYFMTIPEASGLVIQAGMMGRGGEIFVLDMGEPARIVDLAKDMIRLSGLRVGEDIALEFIGLRPGEKLYEELHAEGEDQVATPHPKIRVVNSEPQVTQEISSQIDELICLADGPGALIREHLRTIVPEFGRDRPQPHVAASRAA